MSGAGTLGATTGTLGVSGGALDLGTTSQTTGALTLTGGTIQNGTLNASSFGVQAGTVSAVLAGTGALTQTGAGTTTLSGANTYTGATTISAGGTLALSGGGSIAASSGVADDGTFDISGTTAGASIKTLSGAGTTTLGGQTLTVTAGSTTFSGAVGGTGGFTLSGGTQTLSGANGYTGATTISTGTLALTGTGSIAASSGVADAGTFDISGTTAGASIKTLSGAGTTTLGGQTLTVTAGSTTFSGAVGGTGGFTLSGGTQTLSGTNGYTGATTISAGTLALTGTGSIAASSGVADAGTFDISGTTAGASIVTLSGTGGTTLGSKTLTITNGATTYAGVASGAGGFTVSGGTQTLSGANTYTGATTISAGTLALSGSGSIAASSGVADAGTFDISGTTSGASIKTLSGAGGATLGSKTLTITNGSTTYAGVASGAGGFTVSGGTQTLSGANTFTGATTISAGTLALSGSGSIAASSGVADAGTFDISGTTAGASIKTLSGAGTTTLGAQTLTLTAQSSTFSGAIGGAGGLTLTGAGTETLSGANTYTGATTITGGTLALTGTLAATPTTVGMNGTLSGTGTTAGKTTVNGTLSPGVAGVGTLTFNAPLMFSAASFYNVAITPAATTSTMVNATANLGNATVNVVAGMGNYAANTKYTILTATAGFGATRFGAVTTNMAFLMPALSYDATNNNVFLSVLPINPTAAGTPDYRTAAATGNQRGIASGLTFAGILAGAGSNNPVLNGLNQLTSAQAQAAFDSLTGEGITGAQNVALRASHLFSSAISDLMVFYGSGGANSVTVPATAPLAYAPVNALKTPIAVRDPIAARALYTWRAWGTGFGASETIRTNPVLGTAQQNNGIGGGAVGVDYQWAPGMISGIALGGSDGSFAVGARNTYGSTTGGHAAFYTLANFGPVYAASTTSVSVFGNRTTRNIAGFGGLAPETERGNFSSSELRSRVEFGYRFETGFGATLTPFIAVEAAQLRSNGFNETAIAGAGLFALNVKGQTSASVPMFAGARLTGLVDLGGGLYLRPSIQGAFVRENAPTRNQVAGLISLPGAVFLTDGARPSRNAAQVKAGAELAVLDNVSLSANFDGEFSGRAQTYAGKGAIRVSW